MISPPATRQALKLLLLLVLVLVGVGLWKSGTLTELEPETLAERIDGYGVWGPIVFMGLMTAAVLIGPIPTFPITIASGLAFGPILGVCYSLLGALLGAIIGFYIARFVGREWIARFMQGHISFCGACSDRLLFWVVLAARLLPVVSFGLVSYAAGLTAMRLPAYALATLIGMLPATIAYVLFGASLELSPKMLVFAGLPVLVFMFLLPRWVERHNIFGLKRFFPHLQ
ncbi:MAG: TVP38/TMEM64 family protein [Desulfovermiculus sp.]|nr:TVP38/TMEM64 family protein [Desulfovermiculus sp.]